MKLCRYRPFNMYTLRELSEGEVHYANPKSFNDPLDCAPTIRSDIPPQEQNDLALKMLHKCYKDPEVRQIMAIHQHNSTEDYRDIRYSRGEEYLIKAYNKEILKCLTNEMGKYGVLSLTENHCCPLMWSHYADNHTGICIEYDIRASRITPPSPVDYEEDRSIPLSIIRDWIDTSSESSTETILSKYFFRKAKPWSYENEWRFIHPNQGSWPAPFPIHAIYFGIRCDESVIKTIVSLMKDMDVAFYSMKSDDNNFELYEIAIDDHDIDYYSARPSASLVFGKPYLDRS